MFNTWFDITIIVIIVIAIISGIRSGIIMQLTGFIALILGIIFTGKAAYIISPHIIRLTGINKEIVSIISYIIGFIAIIYIIYIAGKMVHKLVNYTSLGLFNRVFGAIFSICTSLIICSILLNFVLYFDKNSFIIKENIRENSIFFDSIKQIAPTLSPYIKTIDMDDINRANFVSL